MPDGAVMDVKSLAKVLPLYGQMAVGSALKALSVAGHLRRVRGQNGDSGQVRWVTRTYWSRVARDNEWWGTFLAAEMQHPGSGETAVAEVPAPVPVVVPQQRATEPESEPELEPQPEPGSQSETGEERRPSRAYLALARLGRADARLALSAADCAELEQLAVEWFERGVGAEYLTGALTAGLPESVGSPFGLVRRRLRDKLPPRLPTPTTRPASEAPLRRMLVECTECRTPGRPEAFRDGLCKPCRRPDPDPVA
ncbi:MarR family transcriptional regulator [Streptomyces sp. NPDC057496]|uniref:MarR family transcriptional regulator n=1 Tax=Streptomyces sp. NPDC057496 TaxID=3346149 RepID=UPI0036C728B1